MFPFRLAPRNRWWTPCVALAAGAISLELHGCGREDLLHRTSFVGVVCKTSVQEVLVEQKEKYESIAITRCAAFGQCLHNRVSKEKAYEIEMKCLDAASEVVGRQSDAQEEESTQACVGRLNDSTEKGLQAQFDMAREFARGGPLVSDLSNKVNASFTKKIDDIREEYDLCDFDWSEVDKQVRQQEGKEVNGGPHSGNTTLLFESSALRSPIGGAIALRDYLFVNAAVAAIGLVLLVRRGSHAVANEREVLLEPNVADA